MILEECERLLRTARAIRANGVRSLNEADAIEASVFSLAGIEDATHQTGYPAWTIKGWYKYFKSPLEAVRAAMASEEEQSRCSPE